MIAMPQPGSPTSVYAAAYDAWNRLVRIEDLGPEGSSSSGTPATVAEYAYDGRNFRIAKATYAEGEPDETRHFYYNNQWQCLEERLESGEEIVDAAAMQYVWGLRYVDDLILRDRDADESSGTGVLGHSGSGLEERRYALADANFNVVALVAPWGTVTERYRYDAYGTPTVLDMLFSVRVGGSLYAWPYLFTTRRRDAETGLMHYRNREYHPQLGRFVTRDPVQADTNVYRYCGNMPLIAVDPLGENLKWTQSLVGQPELHGSSGFSMQVRQVLSGGIAAPGTQTWQTNDVLLYALITKDNKCVWDKKHHQRLDVNVPQGPPPYRFIDAVSADYNPNSSDTESADDNPNGVEVCFLSIRMTRKLGIRPFVVNAGKVTFSSGELPLGNNYEATEGQWALAGQMAEPTLPSKVNYIYVNRDVCRCCDMAEQQKAATFFRKIWKGGLDPSIGSVALLSYSNLGQWFRITGRTSSVTR